jgi:hypothetical protein
MSPPLLSAVVALAALSLRLLYRLVCRLPFSGMTDARLPLDDYLVWDSLWLRRFIHDAIIMQC